MLGCTRAHTIKCTDKERALEYAVIGFTSHAISVNFVSFFVFCFVLTFGFCAGKFMYKLSMCELRGTPSPHLIDTNRSNVINSIDVYARLPVDAHTKAKIHLKSIFDFQF